MVPQFIALYAKPRNRGWRGTERILTKFSSLNSKPIDGVRRSDVIRVLDEIVAAGAPIRANRTLAAIKKLMAWCLDRGTIEANPIAAMKAPTKERPRHRVLLDGELVACWQAARSEGFPFGSFLQLLILTGQRRGEVAGMRWSEVDLDGASWVIPGHRAKNGAQHEVPLSPLAVDILRRMPRFMTSDLVFTTTGRTAISGFGRLKLRLDQGTGALGWRLHDLRRTAATRMAMMGVQPHVMEAVLNHKSGIVSGVAAVYNRHAYSHEKREALARWCHHVETLAKSLPGPP